MKELPKNSQYENADEQSLIVLIAWAEKYILHLAETLRESERYWEIRRTNENRDKEMIRTLWVKLMFFRLIPPFPLFL